MTVEAQTSEPQLDRIERLLRELMKMLVAINRRLDAVCGHEYKPDEPSKPP